MNSPKQNRVAGEAAITLRCDKCKRAQAYPRDVDPSIPAHVATIVFSRCDRCDNGDFGTERWLDAAGEEVAQ
jgi:hypothetical protein